ncbi:MAG: hypothetical protein V7K55_10835 [Nostoc sp.]
MSWFCCRSQEQVICGICVKLLVDKNLCDRIISWIIDSMCWSGDRI